MLNFLGVLVGCASLGWLLFIQRARPQNTLAAWRWMVFAWAFLFLMHLFSPITYLFYQLSIETIFYSVVWISLFALGDGLTYRHYRSRLSSEIRSEQFAHTPISRSLIFSLTALSLVGFAFLLISIGVDSIVASGLDAGRLRAMQLRGESEGLLKALAFFLTSAGLVAFSIDLCDAILSNRRFLRLSVLGLLSYSATPVLTGGRMSLVLGGMCLFVAAVASLQLRRNRYRYWRYFVISIVFIGMMIVGYLAYVTTARTLGWSGQMDDKISYVNILSGATLDFEFRESLRPYGAAGDAIIEAFYYFSPQLYGLENSLKYYEGELGWGAIQFPYITRRIEQLFNVSLLDSIVLADKWAFEEVGLAANFFRTAVHSTFLDFGFYLSLPFVLLCGFLAGKNRVGVIRKPVPSAVALQGLICSGAAWTIIYSPFIENGWAFPLMWFLLLGLVKWSTRSYSRYITDVPHRYVRDYGINKN